MKLYAYLVEERRKEVWEPIGIVVSFPGQAIRDITSDSDLGVDVHDVRLKRIKTIIDFVQHIPVTKFHSLCPEYDGEMVAFDDKDADVNTLFPSRNGY